MVDEMGEPLLYRPWRMLMEAAARSVGADVTAHDLRHFYASALIAGGARSSRCRYASGICPR